MNWFNRFRRWKHKQFGCPLKTLVIYQSTFPDLFESQIVCSFCRRSEKTEILPNTSATNAYELIRLNVQAREDAIHRILKPLAIGKGETFELP